MTPGPSTYPTSRGAWFGFGQLEGSGLQSSTGTGTGPGPESLLGV